MPEDYDYSPSPGPIRNREEMPSLAQQVRSKQLTTARVILIILGVLTILVNGFLGLNAETLVRKQIDKELEDIGGRGAVAPHKKAELAELEAKAVRITELAAFIFVGIGVIYLIFAVAIYQFPIPITIIALILYLGGQAASAVLDPETFLQGPKFTLVIKVIIIVLLARSIQAAIAFEQERKAERRQREQEETYREEDPRYDDRYDSGGGYRP